jgi:small subunit ribosomal protein S20
MGKASSLSTKKRFRQAKKRQARNKANRTRLKTELKSVRSMAAEGNVDSSRVLPATYSVIDRAVRKGVLSKNAAARHKSRLTKLLKPGA